MRSCLNCGSKTTYTYKDGRRQWNKYKDGYICHKCRQKLIDDPKYNPINSLKIIRFKDKKIFLKENPRKGICSACGKKVGDEYINCLGQIARLKRTHMHHDEYHDDDPLKDTRELCVPCHRKMR